MSSPPAISGDMAALATGQAFGFRVWSELIQQSRGQLHVFLPLLDAGSTPASTPSCTAWATAPPAGGIRGRVRAARL
jgi:hypothetical protein